MTLPVQFVNEVRKGEDFRFCPYCSRVLFWEEADVEDLATSALQDSEIEEAGLSEFVSDDEFSDIL